MLLQKPAILILTPILQCVGLLASFSKHKQGGSITNRNRLLHAGSSYGYATLVGFPLKHTAAIDDAELFYILRASQVIRVKEAGKRGNHEFKG